MKYDVDRPACVVDINRLPLREISEMADGGLRIGALVSNSDLAWHQTVQARYPLLASAILAGASPQLRNAATTGAICCSGPAAITSMIRQRPVTSVIRGPAARPSAA